MPTRLIPPTDRTDDRTRPEAVSPQPEPYAVSDERESRGPKLHDEVTEA